MCLAGQVEAAEAETRIRLELDPGLRVELIGWVVRQVRGEPG